MLAIVIGYGILTGLSVTEPVQSGQLPSGALISYKAVKHSVERTGLQYEPISFVSGGNRFPSY